uniref:Uncharacterized protein n=1 Tax=Setaria viridis TaxID=4556 RepID=A0A4U6TKA7_SETVI|nr:hypothetical protein SEVIR_7G030832v2 [Setaria viridis]
MSAAAWGAIASSSICSRVLEKDDAAKGWRTVSSTTATRRARGRCTVSSSAATRREGGARRARDLVSLV